MVKNLIDLCFDKGYNFEYNYTNDDEGKPLEVVMIDTKQYSETDKLAQIFYETLVKDFVPIYVREVNGIMFFEETYKRKED